MRTLLFRTLLLVMAFGFEASAQAESSKPMQFTLSSAKTASAPNSANGWEMAAADCRASKYIGSGAFLTLSSQDGDYNLTVASSRDQFDVWKDYPVTISAGGQSDFMTIRPTKFDTFVVPVGDIVAFRKAKNFDIVIGERRYNFSDTKISKVVSKLDKCAGTVASSEGNYAQMAPSAGTPTTSTTKDAKATTTTSTSVTATDGATTDTTTTTTTTETVVPATTEVTTAPAAATAPVTAPAALVADPAAVTTPASVDAAVQAAKDAVVNGAQPALDAKPADPAALSAPAVSAPVPTDAAALGVTPAPSPETPADVLPSVSAPADAVPMPTPLDAAATTAPTPVAPAAEAVKVEETAKAAEEKPAAPKKKKKKAAAPKPPVSESEAMADSKANLTYEPRSNQPSCPKGQTCPVVPPSDLEAAEKARLAPVEEQVVSEVKQPAASFVPAPVCPAPVATAPTPEQCAATDEYKNLVRKIGLLEAEKEKLRLNGGKPALGATMHKVAQCASESYQIKELRTELELIKKENADLRRQAEAVKGADNLNDALSELDETVKNGKQ